MRLTIALVLLACGSAHAEGIHPISRISTARCMMLTNSPERLQSPTDLPPIYRLPNVKSQQVGLAAGIMAMRSPPVIVSGMVQVLQANGIWGWMRADFLKEYHAEAVPTAKCQVVQESNGRIGFMTGE